MDKPHLQISTQSLAPQILGKNIFLKEIKVIQNRDVMIYILISFLELLNANTPKNSVTLKTETTSI